jgi:hypothetical protein
VGKSKRPLSILQFYRELKAVTIWAVLKLELLDEDGG